MLIWFTALLEKAQAYNKHYTLIKILSLFIIKFWNELYVCIQSRVFKVF